MMNSSNLKTVDSPAGIYLIVMRIPSPKELNLEKGSVFVAKRVSRLGSHWSVYSRGWFYDVTSDLAEDTERYVFREEKPKVAFRARRDYDPAAGDENGPGADLPCYLAFRVGTTVQPAWIMHAIGQYLVSAMGTYSFVRDNCHEFASAFIACILQPGTLTRMRDYGPGIDWHGNLTQRGMDEWDSRINERKELGGKPKLWKANLHPAFWLIMRSLRWRVSAKDNDFQKIATGSRKSVGQLSPAVRARRLKYLRRTVYDQKEIRTARLLAVSKISCSASHPMVADIYINTAVSIPTAHRLLIPGDWNLSALIPKPDLTTLSDSVQGADEIVLFMIPELCLKNLQIDEVLSLVTMAELPDGSRAYLLPHAYVISVLQTSNNCKGGMSSRIHDAGISGL